MNNEEIDWSKLIPKKERIEYLEIPVVKKLPEGVFVCPSCYGSGRITLIYRDPGPNKEGKCYDCDGTGEVIKCTHPNGCNNLVPNNLNTYPKKLCIEHVTKHEKLDLETKRLRECLHQMRG